MSDSTERAPIHMLHYTEATWDDVPAMLCLLVSEIQQIRQRADHLDPEVLSRTICAAIDLAERKRVYQ